MADLPVALVRERDDVDEGAKLLLLPSAKLLTAPTVDRPYGLSVLAIVALQ